MLPPAALLFGLAAFPAFDPAGFDSATGSRLVPIAAAVVVLAVGLLGFYKSNVVYEFFRPDRLDLRMITPVRPSSAGYPIADPIIVVEYPQYGANSPILLYRAHRKGWSFDLSSISPHVVQRLQRQFGAELLRDDDLVAARSASARARRIPQNAGADRDRRRRHRTVQTELADQE